MPQRTLSRLLKIVSSRTLCLQMYCHQVWPGTLRSLKVISRLRPPLLQGDISSHHRSEVPSTSGSSWQPKTASYFLTRVERDHCVLSGRHANAQDTGVDFVGWRARTRKLHVAQALSRLDLERDRESLDRCQQGSEPDCLLSVVSPPPTTPTKTTTTTTTTYGSPLSMGSTFAVLAGFTVRAVMFEIT